VTGHSLGAGTAALLAALLQRDYSDVICFAFSPPGWLVRLVCQICSLFISCSRKIDARVFCFDVQAVKFEFSAFGILSSSFSFGTLFM